MRFFCPFTSVLLLCCMTLSCTLTHVTIKGTKELVIGRTLELFGSQAYSIWTKPRQHAHGAVFVGVNAEVTSVVVDGMNDAGLTVSAHTFHQATYQHPEQGMANVLFIDLVPYLLEHYASVQQVINALRKEVRVVGNLGHSENIHWGIQDKQGQSCVIEYLDGQLKVHNSTKVGVMTNDPDYTWQLRNLNLYASIGNQYREPINQIHTEEVGLLPRWVSHGSNLLGVPGDLSPPARFVRTFFMKEAAVNANPPKNFADAFFLVNQLISAVAIPIGSVSPSSPKDVGYDNTQWTLIKAPAKSLLYYRTYSDPNWKKIDVSKLDLSPDAKSMHLKMVMRSNTVIADDVTSSLVTDASQEEEERIVLAA